MQTKQTIQFRLASPDRSNGEPSLEVLLANHPSDILAAQRLRYNIFKEEYGAAMPNNGIDHDVFDNYCDHLIVRDTTSQEIIGTYRILPPHQAHKIGRLYSESEFKLDKLHALRARMIEVGRSCVHPDYRTGAAIMLLWSGLAEYLKQGGYTHLIGCASVSMSDGGHAAASLYAQIKDKYLAEPDMQVLPHNRLPIEALNSTLDIEAPPLVKGYLRIGAKVCGEPAWDPDFNSADFLMVLSVAKMSARYARHFGFNTDH
jgi:putative hemolysin